MKTALKYTYMILAIIILNGYYQFLSASQKVYGAQGSLVPAELLDDHKDFKRLSTWLKTFSEESKRKPKPKDITTCDIVIPDFKPITHHPAKEERELAEALELCARKVEHGNMYFARNVNIAILMLHTASEYGEWNACKKMAKILVKGLYGVKPDADHAAIYIKNNPAVALWNEAVRRDDFLARRPDIDVRRFNIISPKVSLIGSFISADSMIVQPDMENYKEAAIAVAEAAAKIQPRQSDQPRSPGEVMLRLSGEGHIGVSEEHDDLKIFYTPKSADDRGLKVTGRVNSPSLSLTIVLPQSPVTIDAPSEDDTNVDETRPLLAPPPPLTGKAIPPFELRHRKPTDTSSRDRARSIEGQG